MRGFRARQDSEFDFRIAGKEGANRMTMRGVLEHCGPGLKSFFLSVSAACLSLSVPALAQETPANQQSQSEPICDIFWREAASAEGGTGEGSENAPRRIAMADCGGQGVMLGEADEMVVVPHRDSGAVLVRLIRGSDQKIWLLSERENGTLLVEDMTGEAARAAGRPATSSLRDVRVNLSRFRETGVVGFGGPGQANERSVEARELALGRRLNARAAARRAEAAQ